MRKTAESGLVTFDGTIIAYTSEHYGSFSVSLADIAVVGEFTTDSGPFIDDWFLVFVPRSGREWFEASMFANGIEQVREQLCIALGFSFQVGLAASVRCASRWQAPPVQLQCVPRNESADDCDYGGND